MICTFDLQITVITCHNIPCKIPPISMRLMLIQLWYSHAVIMNVTSDFMALTLTAPCLCKCADNALLSEWGGAQSQPVYIHASGKYAGGFGIWRKATLSSFCALGTKWTDWTTGNESEASTLIPRSLLCFPVVKCEQLEEYEIITAAPLPWVDSCWTGLLLKEVRKMSCGSKFCF